MRVLRNLFLGLAIFAATSVKAADFYNESEAGDVALRTYSVTNTSYTFTNTAERTLLRPVSIEFSTQTNVNTFSVKHVRVSRASEYGTNMLYAPTNVVYVRTTNYWLLNDQERSRYGQSLVITNDASVALTVVGEPYIGHLDEITISHTPVATTDVTRTHIIFKE